MRNNQSTKSPEKKTSAPKKKASKAQTKKSPAKQKFQTSELVLNSPAYQYCKQAVRLKTTPKYVKKQMRAWMPIVEGKNPKYKVSEKKLKQVEALLKILKMPKGLKAGQSLFECSTKYQWLIYVAVICTVHRDNPSKRKYEINVDEICRKNFKTYTVATLFILLFFTEPKFSRFFSVAPDGSLSREIREAIAETIKSSPIIREFKGKQRFKILRDYIYCNTTEIKYEPLAYSTSRMDGKLPNAFCADEVGALPNSYAIEAMRSGQLNILNKLGFIISTKYPTLNNPFEDWVDYAKKVLDGLIEDETIFALLYEPDNPKNWMTDDLVLQQANPVALESPEIWADLLKKRAYAIAVESARENFCCKHCNIIYSGAGTETYVDVAKLQSCKVSEIDWKNRVVYVGLDLSESNDNTSVSILAVDENNHILADSYAFIPEGRIDEKMSTEHVNYRELLNTGKVIAYLPKNGCNLIDSLYLSDKRIGGPASLIASANNITYHSQLTKVEIEQSGQVRTVVRMEGVHKNDVRAWLPFTIRLYFYRGSEQIRIVHTFIYNGDEHKDMINSLGVRLNVPMRETVYNRHIAFDTDNGIWTEPVQPLDGRRILMTGNDRKRNLQAEQMEGRRIPDYEAFDEKNRLLLDQWAKWDGFRLSQLTDNSWSIRKRATSESPWIGTLTGVRSPGFAFVGDVSGGLGVRLKDFWQSYPSTIEINKARSSEAELTMWLWSPEAEPMNLCHYDTIAHNLNASYEDVQEGMSTPYGIARTSVITLTAYDEYPGKQVLSADAHRLSNDAHLLPTPEYLHEKRAFGIWSLPKDSSDRVEQRLERYIKAYQHHTEQYKWYGFWNYGDIMHTYDNERQDWRYDVGGFAWDNTELATPMWLWYNFLRTGRKDIWRMAEAMTRHCSEVDTYHIGPFAPAVPRRPVSVRQHSTDSTII